MRTILGIALCALLLFTAVEYSFRSIGGLPTVTPGLTPIEAKWKVQQMGGRPTLFIIGDSRVGWGVSAATFSEEAQRQGLKVLPVVTLGIPGNSIPSVLDHLLAWHNGPATVLVAYSPASFFHFGNQLGDIQHSKLTLQDVLDEQIDISMKEWVYSYHMRFTSLLNFFRTHWNGPFKREVNWVARSFTKDGLAQASLGSNDHSAVDIAGHQLDSYQRVIDALLANPEAIQRGNAEFTRTVGIARGRGWRIVLFRMPTGAPIQSVESGLSRLIVPQEIARMTGLPFVDLDSAEMSRHFSYVDQSHLTPSSARSLSAKLSQAVLPWLSE